MRPMIQRFVFLITFLIICFSFSGSGSSEGWSKKSTKATHKFLTFPHGNYIRSYAIYLPNNLPESQPVPLLLALHGGGGSAKKWPSYTNSCFEHLADKDGFILVYPEGMKGHWNDKRNYKRSFAHKNDIDDAGFLAALIDDIASKHAVDKKRIYVAGVSNGGMMAHYMAAEHSDKIAAIAAVISAIPENLIDIINPEHPISVLVMNGTEDSLVPWEGGPVKLGRRVNGRVSSTEETVEFWAKHNETDDTPHIEALPDGDKEDGTTVIKTTYKNGVKGTEVVLYTITGGGHTFPSVEDKRSDLLKFLVSRVLGRKSREVEACEVIWDFFKSHPKQ